MEKGARQVYVAGINAVQDYIEEHLAEEMSIKKLARIAAFSEYHFQRIYKQFTGESLYSFIKRLRLEKAVFLLRSKPKLTIQDIALEVGFSNQASFAKAFKAEYGCAAGSIRRMETKELEVLREKNRRNGKVFFSKEDYIRPVAFELRTEKPQRVLYNRYIGAYKGDAALFAKLFNELYRFAAENELLTESSKWFVIYHDWGDLTEEEKLRLSVCVSCPREKIEQGEFGLTEIAGGRYAVGSFILKEDEYQKAWNYMFAEWLPESGFLPDDRFCFEYYPPRECAEEGEKRVVEIYIPITSQ